MKLTTLAATACILLASATSSFAAIKDFDFSFGQTPGKTTTGTIFGLDDADGTSSLTSISIVGELDTYTLSSADFVINDFQFLGGTLISANVLSFGIIPRGTDPDTLLNNFDITSDLFAGVQEGRLFESASNAGFISLTAVNVVPPIITVPPTVSAVPLPAGGLLLLSGLFGVAGLNRWKKREA